MVGFESSGREGAAGWSLCNPRHSIQEPRKEKSPMGRSVPGWLVRSKYFHGTASPSSLSLAKSSPAPPWRDGGEPLAARTHPHICKPLGGNS